MASGRPRGEILESFITRTRDKDTALTFVKKALKRDGYAVALALAHTERGPSVRELFANGMNLGTNSYELGLTQSPASSLGFFRIPQSSSHPVHRT